MSNRSSKKKEVDLALKQPGTKVDSKPKKSASKTPTKISNQGPSEGEAEKPKKISYKVTGLSSKLKQKIPKGYVAKPSAAFGRGAPVYSEKAIEAVRVKVKVVKQTDKDVTYFENFIMDMVTPLNEEEKLKKFEKLSNADDQPTTYFIALHNVWCKMHFFSHSSNKVDMSKVDERALIGRNESAKLKQSLNEEVNTMKIEIDWLKANLEEVRDEQEKTQSRMEFLEDVVKSVVMPALIAQDPSLLIGAASNRALLKLTAAAASEREVSPASQLKPIADNSLPNTDDTQPVKLELKPIVENSANAATDDKQPVKTELKPIAASKAANEAVIMSEAAK